MSPLVNKVSIVKFDGDRAASIRKAIGLAGGFNFSGAPILIKPNLCAEIDVSGVATVSAQTTKIIIDDILAENRNASINI
ncbi:MAG: hypothetical protein H3Z51_04620, partial [archaeon]|nr:hypothetical protein [archaeon]